LIALIGLRAVSAARTTSSPGSALRTARSADASSRYLLTRGFGSSLGNQFVNQGLPFGVLPYYALCALYALADRHEAEQPVLEDEGDR
jgi:hypothetical protein